MTLPVTIIGGYLGAGKTTLVNQMLRQANGTKLAVLVNEFGELPIDEDLIEAQDDELISIAGGCICCSFGSDLTAALMKLAALRPRPDHIIIESSGVALPGAIAHSIAILPEFSVEGICVLADCANARTLAQDEYIGDTIERQFTDADLILLTKSDLISAEVLSDIQSWISVEWPEPRQIVATNGHVPNAVLLGHFDADQLAKPGQHHDRAYTSAILRPNGPVDAQKLAQALASKVAGLVRAKGFVEDLSGRRALIQVVGPTYDVTYPSETVEPSVVCIGLAHDFDTQSVFRLANIETSESV